LAGSLVSYGKSVESDNPLLPVVFKVDNSIDLLPGSFVEMYIKTRGTQPSLTVPSISLVEEMGNSFVYVQLTPELKNGKSESVKQTESARKLFQDFKKGNVSLAKDPFL
jgi:hypothetical protein